MTEKEIIEKFRPYAILKGEEAYIKAPFALQFIEECDKADLAIIGIEGFKLINDSLQPQLDMIADFSAPIEYEWFRYRVTTIESARKFVQNFSSSTKLIQNILFNFVLSNEKDYLP